MRIPFKAEDGTGYYERRIGFVNGFMSNWTLRDGMAVSVEPVRTVPADELIDRLEEEPEGGPTPWRPSGSA